MLSRRACQWLIDRRIACPEGGYPASEAKYQSVAEWAKAQVENKTASTPNLSKPVKTVPGKPNVG